MSGGLELHWPGKYDDQGRRCPVPRAGATIVERTRYFAGPTPQAESPNRLIEGDNLLSLDALAAAQPGSVDLAYIDPPFATGGRFEVVTPVGEGPKGIAQLRQPAYSDRWSGGTAGLLSMLDPRIRLMHELLAPHGSLYVHVDPTVGHAVKLLLDEVFGPACFQREIVWRIGWVSGFKTKARNWIRNHDLIFFYVKDPSRFTFNKHYMPYPPGYRRRDGALPKGKGVPIDDVWNAGDAELALRGAQSLDSIQIKSFSTEKTGYATQKNESVLRRIIEASSNPGDLVLDAFCGSGTTLAVAESLGRRWIGCDTGRAAVQIATARLLSKPRARDFAVESVADDERRQWEGRVGAKGADVDAVIAERVARAQRQSAKHSAAPSASEDRSGTRRLEPVPAVVSVATSMPAAGQTIAAWRWSVRADICVWSAEDTAAEDTAVLVGEPVMPDGGHALVLQRELFDARLDGEPQRGIVERARLRVRVHGVRTTQDPSAELGPVRIVLHAFGYPDPTRLPAAAQVDDWRMLVERWSVSGAHGVPDSMMFGRFDRERTLPLESPPLALPEPSQAVADTVVEVAVHDVLHREHRLRIVLRPDGRHWTVASALARAEA